MAMPPPVSASAVVPAVPQAVAGGEPAPKAVGVSFDFLRRFMSIGSHPPTDSRVGTPIIDLVRSHPGPHFGPIREKYKGLPSPIEDHLPLSELRSLAHDLGVEMLDEDRELNETAAGWGRALRRPATTTADICFFCLIPDTAGTAHSHGSPLSASSTPPGTGGPLQREIVSKEDPAAGRADTVATESYAELLTRSGELDDEGKPLVGPATHFVSHAWSYDFTTLCRALYEFFDQRPLDDAHRSMYFWIDIFCIDQHRASAGSLPQDFWESTFTDMIASIGRTVVVMLPWSNPTPVTRIWCLWEIFSTIERGAELWIALPEREEKALSDAVVADCQEAIRQVQIDAESAKASAPVDKERISQIILAKHGDFEQINTLVRGALLGLFLCQIAYHNAAPGELARLVAKGARLALTSRPAGAARRRPAIGHAAAGGHLRCVQELHAAGADLTAPDPARGFTPLHLAAINGHVEVIKWVVEATAGATELREAFFGRTPLHCAVAVGDEAAVRCLVELGADLSALDDGFSTPLALALRPTNEEGGIREFDSPKREQWEGGAALSARKAKIAAYLREQAAPETSFEQELAGACGQIDDERVATLLQSHAANGGDLPKVLNSEMTTATGLYRCTPLGHTLGSPQAAIPEDPGVLQSQVSVVTSLLTHGAKVNTVIQRMSPGQLIVQQIPPLHLAALRGLVSAAETLLAHGADPSARSTPHDGGLTALHCAARNHRVGVVRLLLGLDRGFVHDRVLYGHAADLTSLGLARRMGHPTTDGYAHMSSDARKRRLDTIALLLDAVVAGGETGDESHHGVPDPDPSDGAASEGDGGPAAMAIGIQELVAFGFEEAAAVAAMERAGGDGQAALEALLAGDG